MDTCVRCRICNAVVPFSIFSALEVCSGTLLHGYLEKDWKIYKNSFLCIINFTNDYLKGNIFKVFIQGVKKKISLLDEVSLQ